MRLQTKVEVEIEGDIIDYSSKIFMVGSCFSANIGARLSERKFDVLYNPLGTVYNPKSIVDTLQLLRSKGGVERKSLFFHNEQWGHFSFNTDFSSDSQDGAIAAMDSALGRGAKQLEQCDMLIITLGTAYCYHLKDSGGVVSNCHKFRSDSFTRELLSVDSIVEEFSAIFNDDFYRDKRIIFTVSPIRHLKDGLVENSISKAHLLVAVSQLKEMFDNIDYFPAYEIFMDELRDYRFYGVDMVHPSDVGVEYIWERFSESVMSDSCRAQMKRVEGVVRDFNHRVKVPNSESYKKFVKTTLAKAQQLEKEFDMMDFSHEKEKFL